VPDKVKLARLCLLVAGWLKFATAGFFLFIFVAGAVLVGGGERAGLLGSALLGGTGVLLSAASAAAGALDMIAAVGVRRRAAYGRVLGVVLGVLMFPLFPVGTVLGIFVLAGLLGADARAWFSSWPAAY
jgi:hypothetical protein